MNVSRWLKGGGIGKDVLDIIIQFSCYQVTDLWSQLYIWSSLKVAPQWDYQLPIQQQRWWSVGWSLNWRGVGEKMLQHLHQRRCVQWTCPWWPISLHSHSPHTWRIIVYIAVWLALWHERIDVLTHTNSVAIPPFPTTTILLASTSLFWNSW